MNSDLNQSKKEPCESFILLADDDEDDCLLMNEFFASNGYKNKIVTSGSAALDFLRPLNPGSYPALVLLDYTMPPINGEKVLVFIKTSDKLKHIPVIIYSSEMNDNLKSRLEALGAYTCLSKVNWAVELNKLNDMIGALMFSIQSF